MDSLTHIAIGACIGEAILGRKVGRRAMLFGAIAQSFPDIDFICSFWLNTTGNLLAHRGFTHSILFCAMLSLLMAAAERKWHRPRNISSGRWVLFFGLQLFVHIFLDAFNNYGVGWFEPFNHYRISFNVLFVADPLFSIWPGIACIILLFVAKGSRKRRKWALSGIGLSALYLAFSLVNKFNINKAVKENFEAAHIPHSRYFTTPTPFNNLLWYVVSGNDSGYYVGFRSVFDKGISNSYQFFPRNDSLFQSIKNREDVQQLVRFSQNFYTVEKWSDTLVFNDLRFGQMMGWSDPDGKFVFHYFLNEDVDNLMVVQRGRFAGWNRQTFNSLIDRIKGDEKGDSLK